MTPGARVGREADELRPVVIETQVAPFAEGSALISLGDTRVWCTATVDDRVPSWLEGRNRGWVTAEYSMLPRSTHSRTSRDRAANSGRAQEISRLIGRSLRAGLNLRGLGPRQIIIDCDVLQADGGTRTAAITGGFVSLMIACDGLVQQKILKASPVVAPVAAISVGIVGSEARLDLDYDEDRSAAVDCNVVMNGRGELIEVQSSAEGEPYSREQLDHMMDFAAAGIARLIDLQRQALERPIARG
jgi:ribonuclease PH